MSNIVAQKREFYTQGYNILRNSVDPDAVKEALKWINFRLGEEGIHLAYVERVALGKVRGNINEMLWYSHILQLMVALCTLDS